MILLMDSPSARVLDAVIAVNPRVSRRAARNRSMAEKHTKRYVLSYSQILLFPVTPGATERRSGEISNSGQWLAAAVQQPGRPIGRQNCGPRRVPSLPGQAMLES
jgi:hypothetical protein